MMRLRVRLGGTTFSARVLDEAPPQGIESLKAALPLTATVLQEEWSGAMLKTVDPVVPELDATGAIPEFYQSPGRLYFEVRSGALALCYGPGRLQTAAAPQPTVAIAEVTSAESEFARVCGMVQFEGATALVIEESSDAAAAPSHASPSDGRVRIVLDGVAASASLLSVEHPTICASFRSKLPMAGVATNTHSSGPLLRFWNEAEETQGETVLDLPANEAELTQTVLAPSYIYYLPKVGFRGIRIPFRHPTVMRSAVIGGGMGLIAVARFDGDWSAFRAAAERLRWEGALKIRFESIS